MIARFLRSRYLLWCGLAVYALGKLLLNVDPLGFRVDWNLPYQVAALRGIALGTDGFVPWNYANGGTPLFYPTLAPYLAFVSALAWVIPIAGLIERLIIALSLVAGAEGMFRLCRRFIGAPADAVPAAALLGGAAYAYSSYLFTKLCQGVLQEGLSYALLPFVALAILTACEESGKKRKFSLAMLAGLLAALSAVQTQYLAISLAIVAAIALWKRAPIVATVCVVGTLVASMYAIMPAMASVHEVTGSFQAQTPLEVIAAWAPQPFDAIRQSGYVGAFDVASVSAGASATFWYIAGTLLFVGSVLGLTMYGDRRATSLAIVQVAIVFLASLPKVAAPLYFFLLQHIPLAFMFRESYRLLSLFAFIEAIGVAAMVVVLTRLDSVTLRRLLTIAFSLGLIWFFWYNSFIIATTVVVAIFIERNLTLSSTVVRSLAAGTGLFLVVGASPFLGYGLGSQVQSFHPPRSAYDVYSSISESSRNARVLYLPFLLPLAPAGLAYSGTDPAISWAPKPSFGNYVPVRIEKQFADALYFGSPKSARIMADWLDVGYIDERKWVETRFYSSTPMFRIGRFPTDPFSFSSAHAAVSKLRGSRALIKPPDDQEWAYARESPGSFASDGLPTVVAGGLKIAVDSYARGRPIAAVGQNGAEAIRSLIKLGAPIALDRDGVTELAVALMPRSAFEDAALEATNVDAELGWAGQGDWNSWWWLAPTMMDAFEDSAMIAKIYDKALRVKNLHASGRVRVYLKYWVGVTGGLLRVEYAGQRWILNTNVASKFAGFRWATFEVANATDGDVLRIIGGRTGDEVIARVALVPSALAFAAEREARALIAASARVPGEPKHSRSGSVRTTPLAQVGNFAYRIPDWARTTVLATGFSSLWASSAPSVHFIANGYANGWVSTGAGAGSIGLRSRGLLFVGLVLSGTYAVLTLTFLALSRVEKNATG